MPESDSDASEVLWLFSSNRRALYAQDVSNVAALPVGARYRFRYRRDWVGSGALESWKSENLEGSEAIIVFSFQHEAGIHPPAFIPVRAAQVTNSEILGSFCVIDFELGDHSALPAHSRGAREGLPSLGNNVQAFSRAVETLLGEGHPGGDPNKSAVTGPQPIGLLDPNPPLNEAWERIVEHLAASGSFPQHLFFRVASLLEVGGKPLDPSEGRYFLTAGKTYELTLAHYQPEPFSHRRGLVIVADDESIAVQGPKSLAVTSGYDSVRVRFHAKYRDEPIDTTLTVEPPSGEEGSRVELPLRITPPKSEKALRVGVGSVAVLAAAAPGVVNDFSGRALSAVLVLITAGAAGTAWLSARSRIRLPKK